MIKNFIIVFTAIVTSLFPQTNSPEYLIGSIENVCMNPVFSPDDSKIAFTKLGYNGLWILDRITNTTFQLTDEPAAGFGFKWSSDSRSILTRVAKYENSRRLNAVKIFNIDSRDSFQLTDYETMMPFLPEWADDDTKVILPTNSGYELLNSEKLKKLNNTKSQLSSYSRFDKIIMINNLLGRSEQVFIPILNAEIINLTLSPNKNKIAFEVMGGNLYTMNNDGTNLIDLGKGHRPRWSSDSMRLIYMITEDDGRNYTASDIYIVNADGTNKINITNTNNLIELNPCFSNDGQMVVYDVYETGSIYLISVK